MINFFTEWVFFATLMALITGIIKHDKIRNNLKQHWILWIGIPIWVPLVAMALGWRKIKYHKPMNIIHLVADWLYFNEDITF